jgi:CBS domain-containing protein
MLPVFHHHHHLLLVLFRSFVPTTDGQGVTGLGIVDDAGKLVGEISVRDLRGMGWDAAGFWRLYGTIRAFKEWVFTVTPKPDTLYCRPTDTLATIMSAMVSIKAHRVWECNAAGKPIKCISTRDVLQNIFAKAQVGDGKVVPSSFPLPA